MQLENGTPKRRFGDSPPVKVDYPGWKMTDQYGPVEAVVPAVGWHAVFRDKETGERGSHKVIAWVAVSEGDCSIEKITTWRGLCVWEDGPDYAETFSDFEKYVYEGWE